MNRNTEMHFGNIPAVHMERSKFDLSSSVTTTGNVGDCIPVKAWEILPGDTVQMDMGEVIRLTTPIAPTFDNLICDTYFFFVPRRLTMDNWQKFWGENDNEWASSYNYEIPQVTSPTGGWTKGTIADYLSIPTKIANLPVDACYFRGYVKIWNDWFRDENLKKASHIYTDDTGRTGTNGTTYVSDPELGGMPLKAAKTADQFTKCQPTPQKGPAVSVPIGTEAPVFAGDMHAGTTYPNFTPLKWTTGSGTEFKPTDGYKAMIGVYGDSGKGITGCDSTVAGTKAHSLIPANLWTDLSQATMATINELRTAFAIQKYYESVALYGSRYIEILRGIFGVESSDARLQRAEYLGGTRVPINMQAVIQTSSTDSTSPQGHAVGYSATSHSESIFTKSFEEHGMLYCIMVTRIDKHTYQQGLDRMFSRKKWTDFYVPHFAHLGARPVYNKEIYAQGNSVVDTDGNIIDDQVFGYQEAYSEYRFQQNVVTGEMRSNVNATGGLDFYHYADKYASLPQLGSSWIDEDETTVDRTLVLPHSTTDQLDMNIYFDCQFTRVMPIYSLPGLIDHV